MFGSVEKAFDLGAAGVGATIYFGSNESMRQLQEVSEVLEHAHQLGMFTVLWCYVRNSAFTVDGTNYEAAALMDGAKEEVLAFRGFPKPHWRRIWSTNPLERVNKEIKRRTKVVGILPSGTSAIRLVGAILSDLHDEWTVSYRRYLPEHTITSLTETCDTHRAAPDQLGTGWPPPGITPRKPNTRRDSARALLVVGLEDRREGE